MADTIKCMDCKYARKRSPFDFKKYGSRGFPYECVKERQTTYKRPTDSCEDAERAV